MILDTSPNREPLKAQLDAASNKLDGKLSLDDATKALVEVVEDILKRVEALEDKGWTMEDMNGPTRLCGRQVRWSG